MRIWLETSHHAAFNIGGWAFVRADGGGIAGRAGGARRTPAEPVALAGLLAALADMAADRPVTLYTASPLIAAVPHRLAAGPEDAPTEHLELWAQAMTALKGRQVQFLHATADSGGPTGFCRAWADQALEKAKTSGTFSVAIPRPNLARAGL